MNEEHQTVSTIPHPQAGEQLPKSNRLWYPDGNLLINADGKSCLVYKWILMMHCPELGAQITKLTLERPKNVRVVLLMDEPTVLSEYFLRALYDASYFDPTKSQDVEVVRSISYLSMKYEVPFLQDRVSQFLRNAYPQNDQGRYRNAYGAVTRLLPADHPEVHIAALNLAINHGIMDALPAIYYEICTQMTAETLKVAKVRTAKGHTYGLSADDIARCNDARQIFCVKLREFAQDALTTCQMPSWLCHNAECQSVLLNMYMDVCKRTEHEQGQVYDPLRMLWNELKLPICEVCSSKVGKKQDENCRLLWQQMPDILDIGTWETLHQATADLALENARPVV